MNWTPKYLLEQLNKLGANVDRTSCGIVIVPTFNKQTISTLIENESELSIIDPRKFEELVADLLHADGWQKVNLVSRINAPGPDIIAFGNQNTSNQSEMIIVECKRWNKAVGIDVVRTVMYWDQLEYKSNNAMIATTSRFTSNAKYQREHFHRWNLSLKDRQDMIIWMNRNIEYFNSIHVPTKKCLSVLAMDNQVYSLLRGKTPSQGGMPDLQVVDSACQRCGGLIVCGTASTNAGLVVDYYQDYFHVCTECRWAEYHEEKESNLGGGALTSAWESCPMCKRNYLGLL